MQQYRLARAQFKLAHDKLRLDLFDRRYRVYSAAARMLACIERDGEASNEEFRRFKRGIWTRRFLFDKDVVAYLDNLRERVIDLRFWRRRVKDEPNVSETDRAKAIKVETESLVWFCEEVDTMHDRFKPYLGFEHIR